MFMQKRRGIDLMSRAETSNIQEESNDAENTVHEATTYSNKKTRNTRGKTMLPKVWKAPMGRKLPVECNDLGQPVGTNSSTFTSFCGTVARNTEAAPLNYDRWDLMPQSFKDKQYSLLKVIKILYLVLFEPFNVNLALFSLEKYFELPEVLGPWINASIGRKWRDYKGELKAKYYDEMLPIAKNIANLPPDVPIHQWIHLVNYFESAKAKVQENEKPIGVVAFYFATHQHKNGNLVDDEASSVMEKAMKELTDMNVSIDSTSENDISLQQVAMSRVRGKEHSGRVRGLGLGPTPTKVFGSSRFSANPFGQPSQEVTGLKNRVVDLESEVAQIPELKSQVATIPLLEARIDSMMMIIQSTFLILIF
ncbi:Transposase, Ptta/En/Spm, plant [Corchorus olitorius]|uniref:Transposase, Ptta/En/Spm, plant n=1 Tax=Corchorus olitorius TaxID=93759 RepID=A0A1R3KMM0_9ROSI|nr:Transposase, Ptta/En/Spm, plant [Corchorus olitorius]